MTGREGAENFPRPSSKAYIPGDETRQATFVNGWIDEADALRHRGSERVRLERSLAEETESVDKRAG